MRKIFIFCILILLFCTSSFAQQVDKVKLDKAIKEANKLFEKTYPEIYSRYCKGQTPTIKTYKLEYGSCKGLEMISISYNYPEWAAKKNNLLSGLALSADVNGKTGSVITTWLWPDMIGKIHDKDANKCLSIPKKNK